MLRYFYGQLFALVFYLYGVKQVRQMLRGELYIKYRTDDLHNRADILWHRSVLSFLNLIKRFSSRYDLIELVRYLFLSCTVVHK